MALPVSSLSTLCRAIADSLSHELNQGDTGVRVTIGNPVNAVPGPSEPHHCNFFFFKVEPCEFQPDALPGETEYMRLYCLITPFCILEESVSTGENELRLLGEIIRFYKETPVTTIEVGTESFVIQTIPHVMGMEQVNQLWGTQGDVVYRPSVAYEISLLPVIPQTPAIAPPRAGSVGLGVQGKMAAVNPPFSVPLPTPKSPLTIDTTQENWAPDICLVFNDQCASSLCFEVSSPLLASFIPRIWIAGKQGAPLTLCWQVWERSSGWIDHGVTTAATVSSPALDPDNIAGASTVTLALPFTDRPGQFMLFARRDYRRAADNVPVSIRSNPILISLYLV